MSMKDGAYLPECGYLTVFGAPGRDEADFKDTDVRQTSTSFKGNQNRSSSLAKSPMDSNNYLQNSENWGFFLYHPVKYELFKLQIIELFKLQIRLPFRWHQNRWSTSKDNWDIRKRNFSQIWPPGITLPWRFREKSIWLSMLWNIQCYHLEYSFFHCLTRANIYDGRRVPPKKRFFWFFWYTR